MLIAKRAARFFERLANPDEQTQAPKGVLLYSPNLLRFVAALCYLIWLAGFVNNFFISDFFRRSFSDRQINDLFYSQFALVLVGALGTGLVIYFARTRYRLCMLAASMLAIASSMIASAYMSGLSINPHMLLAVTPLLLIGFTVGRDGLVIISGWIVAVYVFLYLADTWGWWPKPDSVTVDFVRHENLSAFVILLLVVAAVEFYVVKIAVTLRQQGQLHRALDVEQQRRLELLSRLVAAKDEERRQLAYMLHEGPVQDLAAVRMGIWHDMDREKMLVTLDQALQTLRTVTRDLHPVELDLYGLLAALERLASRQQGESGIRIEIICPHEPSIDPPTSRVLYRIAQEALINIRKHSGARHAWLNLEETDRTLTMQVRDDGRGFDVAHGQREAAETGHFGLATLHELPLAVGGKLEIASGPGEGTSVRVSVPLKQSGRLKNSELSGEETVAEIAMGSQDEQDRS